MTAHFEEQGKTADDAGDLANISTTGMFFAGILLTWLLEKGLHSYADMRADSQAAADAAACTDPNCADENCGPNGESVVNLDNVLAANLLRSFLPRLPFHY